MNDILTFMGQDSPAWLTRLTTIIAILSGAGLFILWCWNSTKYSALVYGLFIVAVMDVFYGIIISNPHFHYPSFAMISLIAITVWLDGVCIWGFNIARAEAKKKLQSH
jgi:hypothetical protein